MSKVSTEQVFAAAMAAFRINGNSVLRESIEGKTANKVLIESELSNSSIVTDEDRAAAKQLIEFLTHQQTLAGLTGKTLSEFNQLVTLLASTEKITKRLIGIAQWAPRLQQDLQRAQEIRNQLAVLSYGSKYLGRIGEKVQIGFVTVQKRYNKTYQAWRYIGHDGRGNIVGFISKHNFEKSEFQINGRIKTTETSRFAENGKTTYLSHVKEL